MRLNNDLKLLNMSANDSMVVTYGFLILLQVIMSKNLNDYNMYMAYNYAMRMMKL